MPKPGERDAMIYIYTDSDAPARQQRLAECARQYVSWRGLSDSEFTVAKSAAGKPYFPHSPHIHFSISHSGEYWVAAFSGQNVGLDIQQHLQRDYLAVAKRWYHPQEFAAVKQYGASCFFDIWSAKESLLKYSGEGLSAAFSTFSVIEKGQIAALNSGLHLQTLKLLAGYSLCICGKNLGRIYSQ